MTGYKDERKNVILLFIKALLLTVGFLLLVSLAKKECVAWDGYDPSLRAKLIRPVVCRLGLYASNFQYRYTDGNLAGVSVPTLLVYVVVLYFIFVGILLMMKQLRSRRK